MLINETSSYVNDMTQIQIEKCFDKNMLFDILIVNKVTIEKGGPFIIF